MTERSVVLATPVASAMPLAAAPVAAAPAASATVSARSTVLVPPLARHSPAVTFTAPAESSALHITDAPGGGRQQQQHRRAVVVVPRRACGRPYDPLRHLGRAQLHLETALRYVSSPRPGVFPALCCAASTPRPSNRDHRVGYSIARRVHLYIRERDANTFVEREPAGVRIVLSPGWCLGRVPPAPLQRAARSWSFVEPSCFGQYSARSGRFAGRPWCCPAPLARPPP